MCLDQCATFILFYFSHSVEDLLMCLGSLSRHRPFGKALAVRYMSHIYL